MWYLLLLWLSHYKDWCSTFTDRISRILLLQVYGNSCRLIVKLWCICSNWWFGHQIKMFHMVFLVLQALELLRVHLLKVSWFFTVLKHRHMTVTLRLIQTVLKNAHLLAMKTYHAYYILAYRLLWSLLPLLCFVLPIHLEHVWPKYFIKAAFNSTHISEWISATLLLFHASQFPVMSDGSWP